MSSPARAGSSTHVDGVTTANAVGTNQGADEFFTSNCDGTTLTHGYRFKSEDDAKTLNFCYAAPDPGASARPPTSTPDGANGPGKQA